MTARQAFRFLIPLVLSFSALPAPGYLMWEIEKDGRTATVLGTLHVLDDRFYPLPAEVEQAYLDADLVVFETDLSPDRAKAARRAILARAVYPDGETAADHLDPETARALRAYCSRATVNYDSLVRLKPWMIALNLTNIELVRAGALLANGIDHHLFRRAENDGKDLGFLESVDDQTAAFEALEDETQGELLRKTLADFADLRGTLEQIYATWSTGDAAGLAALIDDSFAEFPDIRAVLLDDRNRAWAEAIPGQIALAERPLILVGAAHLVGDDNLLDRLAADGYAVRKLPGTGP